jgi:hypothetical protein
MAIGLGISLALHVEFEKLIENWKSSQGKGKSFHFYGFFCQKSADVDRHPQARFWAEAPEGSGIKRGCDVNGVHHD